MPLRYYSVQLQSFRINITVHLVETLHCGNLTSIESRIGQLFDCEQSTYSYACASGLKKTHALVEVLASVPTLCSQSLIHANLVKQNWQLFCWNCLSNYLSCLSVKSLAFPGLKILRENFLSMAEVCCLKLATLYSNSLRCKFPSCQITPAIMPPPPNSKELLAFYAHPLDKKIPQFSFRLVLDNVTLETSGDYRCQVMFRICNVWARYFLFSSSF